MAERRMFTQKITDSDAFTEMPSSTQALYFHLNLSSDDDGFCSKINSCIFKAKASSDDLKILISKNFILPFESGVIVIKHWRMHNLLRKDRYHETEYTDEKSQLYLKENGAYTFDESQGEKLLATKWQPDGNQMAPEDRIGKDSIGKDNKEKKNIKRKEKLQTSIVTIFNFWNAKNIIVHRDLTAEREKAIEQAITTYGENDVMTAIDRYAKAYHDKEFKTCEYAWDLVKFLKQKNALPDFLDDGSKWCNYLSFLSNSKPTTPIKRQRLTYEATEEDIEEYDRRFKV